MKKGKLGQRSRNIIVVSVFLVILNISLGFFLTRQSNKALTSQIQGRMLDLANTAADMINGNEFIVVLPVDSAGEMDSLFQEADKVIAEENKTQKPYHNPLALSKGYAVFDKEKDTAYREVFKRADDRMYQDKAAYYRQFPENRRR